MTANILHLSHTDIRVDSRILKQLKVLAALNKKIIGIGVNSSEMDEKVYSNEQLDIITLELLTKKINILPRFLRHVLNFFELINLTYVYCSCSLS